MCSIKRLREIERNRDDDGRKERFSISVNPIIQDHRCERSGMKSYALPRLIKLQANTSAHFRELFSYQDRGNENSEKWKLGKSIRLRF